MATGAVILRPREALGDATPASCDACSPRRYPSALPRSSTRCTARSDSWAGTGGIRWLHDWVNVSYDLGGEYVGLEEIDERE